MSWAIANIGVRYAVWKLLPILWTAGDIARRLQPAIAAAHRSGNAIPQKEGSLFSAAISDADLINGTVVGAHVFTMFTDAVYDDEESAQDRISPYFPEEARYCVTADPVDGSIFYLDNLPLFAVILTILDRNTMVAAVVYLPISDTFYIGIAGDGAYTTNGRKVHNSLNLWRPFNLAPAPPPIVITFFPNAAVHAALQSADLRLLPVSNYKEGAPDWRWSSTSVLTGEACGMVHSNVSARDWGASAFIAGLAGGKTNAFTIDPATLTIPELIVGARPEIYDRIVSSLRGVRV
jgi:fructose-1,6-bisphosphatase/inositol monophosphatase family enzyme